MPNALLPVARDVYQLPWLTQLFNAFLVGDVLVDAGTRYARGGLVRRLRRAGRPVLAHALTHVHPDHAGGSKRACEQLGVPLWCPDLEADAMEAGLATYRGALVHRFAQRSLSAGGHPVARRLREGDELSAGFVALETPGHSPGHLSFWRESDRTLLAGEVVLNLGLRLTEPLSVFTSDPAENRRSARRLAALRPEVVCFSHGRQLRDQERFQSFVASLS